jgi:ABC-type transport system substrate-binding protein
VGPAFGRFYNPDLKPDPYDPNKAAEELAAAGYSVRVTPPAKIAAAGTPVMTLGTRVRGYTSVAGMIVIVQQSIDRQTWKSVAAATADVSGNYEVAVPGPPAFGSAWYRTNFTGYVLNETYAGKAFSVDQANAYISKGMTVGGRGLLSESLTDPIAISSVTNDTALVLVIVVALVVMALVALRRRKASTLSRTTK